MSTAEQSSTHRRSSLWAMGQGGHTPEGSRFSATLPSAIRLALLIPFSGNYSPTRLATRPFQDHMSSSLLPQWAGANKGGCSLQAVTIGDQSLPQKFRTGIQKSFPGSLRVAEPALYKPGSSQWCLFSVSELDPQQMLRDSQVGRELCSKKQRWGNTLMTLDSLVPGFSEARMHPCPWVLQVMS